MKNNTFIKIRQLVSIVICKESYIIKHTVESVGQRHSMDKSFVGSADFVGFVVFVVFVSDVVFVKYRYSVGTVGSVGGMGSLGFVGYPPPCSPPYLL